MGEDGQRAGRVEQRNIAQLEAEFSNLREELNAQIELLVDTLLEHSAEIDKVGSAMTDAHHRGANVPLSPFHGHRNEDFSQYIKQFELICDANNYAEGKRAQILGSYLRDKAFFIYDSLPTATKDDYAALKRALCDKFQTTDYRRYAHQKFQERRQQATETVPDYACDLHRMGLAALSEVNADQRDALIREKFIAGLLPHLRELIVYSNPESFHEAMTLAERLEGLQTNKADSAARKVMLLENISDRLSNLEIQNRRTEDARHCPDVTYVMEAPNRKVEDGFTIQRKFNLGNFRQGFRPSGMICYRCNRTGHMARNCGRTRDMSTVVCRLCNRTGHFARNCQRRGASLGRRAPHTNNMTFDRSGARNSPLPQPERLNRTMATTAAPTQVEYCNPGAQTEFARWMPLSAAMWVAEPAVEQAATAITTDKVKEIEGHGVLLPLATPEPRNEDEDADINLAQVNVGHSDMTDKENKYSLPKWVMSRMTSRRLTIKICLTYLFCCCVVAMTTGAIAATSNGDHRHSEPMLCQASGGKALWKLPSTFNCPEGNHSVDRQVTPLKFRLYKRNYIQYKSDAWKCVRVTEQVETFTYFFGDENLKKSKKFAESVSTEDCVTMKHYKTCNGQPMIYQGGIYQTDNKLDWYYPGGGINCCRWKQFKVTNCFMYKTRVYKRHGTQDMESTAGDVTNCNYRSGQCVLSDGAFLLWDVREESLCNILPWKELDGKISGTSWLSDDSNLALTFTKHERTVDCGGKPLLLSDQGLPVQPLTDHAPNRRKRQFNLTELKHLGKLVGKGGVVSSAQLAASLQALEVRWEENMQFAFSHALNNVCNFMRSIIELLKTQVLANPTMAIRALTNQTDIFAQSGGNTIEVFPCTQLNRFHYQFKPMNDTCTTQVPIKFKINNKTSDGYLDPVTNIIHRYGVPTDCNLVKQVPLTLRDKTYIYHASNGEIIPAQDIPEIKVLQWNVEPVIDMKATIFHEIVIYNWEELQTHISLNDIMGGLDRQRAVLRHIGISDQDSNPHDAAENAVSHIMNMGYFGFLRGLATNIYQVWTFLVCLYVTICIVIVHCIPMHAMPAALNAGNAIQRVKGIWQRWKRRRDLRQRNLPQPNPEISDPDTMDEAVLSQFTTALMQRMNRRTPKAILPPRDVEMTEPSAPLMDASQSASMTTFSQSQLAKPTTTVQPFRINVLSSENETAIVVMVEGIVVECLLDTGAGHTILSTRLSKLLGLQPQKSTQKVVSVTGQEVSILGETEVTARLAGLTMRGNALITDQTSYEVILGINFLRQLGNININYRERTIKINGVEIKMITSTNGNDEEDMVVEKMLKSTKQMCLKETQKMVKFEPKTYLISPNLESSGSDEDPLAFIQEVSVDANGEITHNDSKEPFSLECACADCTCTPCHSVIAREHRIFALLGSSEIAIDVLLEGMRVQTLVDTGSSLTVIPMRIAGLLRNPIKQHDIQIMSMTGHKLSVAGELETIIRIGNRDITGTVIVAEESPYDLIIGVDLLQQLESVKVNFKNRTIDLGNESLPMTATKRVIGVYLCQQARILPKSSITVMGVCFGLSPAETAEQAACCFSPSTKLLSKYDVISQDAIVSPNQKLIPVTVTNCDRAPKFLPEKATLGYLDVLEPEEMYLLDKQEPGKEAYVPTGVRRSKTEMDQLRQEIQLAPTTSANNQQLLRKLIEKYEVLFAKSEYDLGETKLVEHTIDTGDARPISQKPYRTPHSLRPYLQKKIEEMLDHGIIQPSKSNWSSPVVLVKKKDTTELRFCVDNRKLNDVTVKDNYPLKRIEDAFDMLYNAQYFATLDLQSGYWQIPIQESDRSKTAFITSEGLYEYTKMNFGLCNAPATFQRLMDQVLRGLDLKICMSYIDDIIIPADSIQQLVTRLEAVFQRLLSAGLKLKLRKCKFGLEQLKFLGFIVSKEGLKADPEKIEKILQAKPPESRDELRGFLGFAGWCKRFIESYAKIAWPLTDLLQQSKAFKWQPAAEHAFEKLKVLYSEPPILAYPNMAAPFIICTDASNWAIGAVLCQNDKTEKERPISYDSRVLNSSERNYSTIEKEMLAIYWAVVKKYRVYVYGHEFTVYTDHKPLLGVWKAPPNEGRLGKWCLRMQEYRPNMTLAYGEGKSNVVADYLSRLPERPNQIQPAMVLVASSEVADLRNDQLSDEIFGPILKYLETGESPDDQKMLRRIQKWTPFYEIVDGVLYKRSAKYNKLLVALPKPRRQQVLTANHDSLLGGHLGIRKTLSKIEKRYYWPKYYQDVVNWCRGCVACQSRKPPAKGVKTPLQPISVGYVNQRWGWDICGPLPLSQQGNRYILVCMEYFTKFPELFALPDTKAERLAKIFVEHSVLRYGCPEVLLSDQGLNVHSTMIQQICKMLDISKLRTSAYHPQTDGLVERFNRTLHNMISAYVNDGHNDWCEFLPFLEFAYRSSVHETTKESPFFLMYGYDPILPIDQSLMPSHPGYITTDDDYKAYILYALLRSRRLVSSTITQQQKKQKATYDKTAADHTFLEGDRILVFTPANKKGRTKKFARKWIGPYRILQVSSNGANLLIQAIGGKRATRTSWIHANRAKRLHPESGPWPVPQNYITKSGIVNENTSASDPNDNYRDKTASGAVTPSAQKSAKQTKTVQAKSTSKVERNKEACAKCKKRTGDNRWIQCDRCDKWYHFQCVGLTIEPLDTQWYCPTCHTVSRNSDDDPDRQSPQLESDAESDTTVLTVGEDTPTSA